MKVSIAIACAAWCVLVTAVLLGCRTHERTMDLWISAVGFPIGGYAFPMGLVWVFANAVASADETSIYGAGKAVQLKLLRGPTVLWINTVVVLYPTITLVMAAYALLFPAHVFAGS